MESLAAIQQLLAECRPKHLSHGYPLEVRRKVATYARARIASGRSRGEVAAELGLSRTCINDWLRSSPSLLPVQLIQEEPPKEVANLVLTSPRGFRVEGLQLHQLRELLEKLG